MRQREAISAAVGLLALVVLSGCPGNSIQPLQETASTSLPPPTVVLVYKFGVNLNEVTANQGRLQRRIDAVEGTTQDEQAQQLAQDVSDQLADELVARINNLGLPAQRASQDTPVGPGALLITGHFIDVDAGNRAQRLVIGLGVGQSKLDTEVQVLVPADGSYRDVLAFRTHADSGEMPGAAVTMGAGAAAQGGMTAGMAAANVAVSGAKSYRSAMGAMAGRSADRAAEYLSQFFGREGWIPPDKVQRPLMGQ